MNRYNDGASSLCLTVPAMRLNTAFLIPFLLMVDGFVGAQDFQRLQYNREQAVDLGVGLWAWPLPMDWDEDGDWDLVVSCPDKPYSGTYYFENTTGNVKLPIFEPGKRIGPGMKNVQVSQIEDQSRVLFSNREFQGFLGSGFDLKSTRNVLPSAKIHQGLGNQRFNVWSYVDYDGDEALDVIVGADDWGYYGWDDGFDSEGNWKKGPLHGVVYWLRNRGTNTEPKYEHPKRIQADGNDLNVYGNPMPNFADFDGDGDLDLVCGEFLDGLSYFENTGSRRTPEFMSRGYLMHGGAKITMHVQMITPTAIDWDKDGDADLVVGDEDGRVALWENTGRVENHQPKFQPPTYFQQRSRDLKFGALVTPVAFDWDNDGDHDLVCGNTSGNIAWFENLSSDGLDAVWSPPRLVHADGEPIRFLAGPNGSIQGPAEAKWGYTTFSVADWDGDGKPDLVCNSILGRIDWFKNVGTLSEPKFEAGKPVHIEWDEDAKKPSWVWWRPSENELVTQWRTTPLVQDWNADGLADLVMLDEQGYLAFYERVVERGIYKLKPGKRIFKGDWYDNRQRKKTAEDELLRLNVADNGGSGRRKLCFVDWDQDGELDLIVNSQNANWLRNEGTIDGITQFKDMGPVSKQVLAGHTTSPTTADWNGDGVPDLLLGAEDGRIYYLENPHGRK